MGEKLTELTIRKVGGWWVVGAYVVLWWVPVLWWMGGAARGEGFSPLTHHLTLRQVIVMVLLVMFAMPVFDVSGACALCCSWHCMGQRSVGWSGGWACPRGSSRTAGLHTMGGGVHGRRRLAAMGVSRPASCLQSLAHCCSHPLVGAVGYYGGAPMLEEGGLDILHSAFENGNTTAFQLAVDVSAGRYISWISLP